MPSENDDKRSKKSGSVFISEYALGEFVYLITDIHQYRKMVDGILFKLAGTEYRLCCGTEGTWHSAEEISREKQVQMKLEQES